jgi:hypothetical protein
VLGHLLVQRGLQDRFGQLLEQPVRPGQRQALFLGQPDQLDRSLLPADCSAFFLVTSSSVVITATFLAEHRSACQAGNTVKSTVPANR